MKLRLLLFTLLVGLWAQSGFAQIALDNKTNCFAHSGPSNPITCNITVNATTNGVLTVCSSTNGTTPATSAITYNGVSLTKVTGTDHDSGGNNISLWQLTAANGLVTGTHTLSITTTGTLSEAGSSAESFTGVDQTTPLSNGTANDGIGNGPTSLTVTSSSGSLVVDCEVESNSGGAPTADASQGNVLSQASDIASGYGQSTKTGAASVVMAWSFGAFAFWDAAGASLNQAVVTATTTIIGGKVFH